MKSSAPSDATNSRRGPLAVAVTRAPRAFASCTATWPTPPEAPFTRTRLPADTCARSQRVTAVAPTHASAAASRKSIPAGSGNTDLTGTAQKSANVPRAHENGSTKPQTRSPGLTPSTPLPTFATTPAKSLPMVLGKPCFTRKRNLPAAIFQSTGLTLAYRTPTTTSPAAASGGGTSSSLRSPGDPNEW